MPQKSQQRSAASSGQVKIHEMAMPYCDSCAGEALKAEMQGRLYQAIVKQVGVGKSSVRCPLKKAAVEDGEAGWSCRSFLLTQLVEETVVLPEIKHHVAVHRRRSCSHLRLSQSTSRST